MNNADNDPVVDMDIVSPTNGKKKVIKKVIVKKKTITNHNSNRVASPDDVQTTAAEAFETDNVNFDEPQQEQQQQQPQQEQPPPPQQQSERNQDGVEVERDAVLIDSYDLPPLLPSVNVVINQNVVSSAQSQINHNTTLSPFALMYADYKILTIHSVLLWATTIIWVVLWVLRQDGKGTDGSRPGDDADFLMHVRWFFWFISLIQYALHAIAYCPFLDSIFNLRKHKICDWIYDLSGRDDSTLSPVRFAETLRGYVFTSPAMIAVHPHAGTGGYADAGNMFIFEANVVNNKGDDREINYQGIDLIKTLNKADKLQFITVVVQNAFNSFEDQKKILEVLGQQCPGCVVRLEHITFSNQAFTVARTSQHGHANNTALSMTFCVLPPRLVSQQILNEQKRKREDQTQSLLNDSHGGAGGATFSDSETLSGLESSVSFSQQHYSFQPTLPTFFKVLLSSATHFFSYAFALEPLYLVFYFKYISHVKVTSDRSWVYSQGSADVA